MRFQCRGRIDLPDNFRLTLAAAPSRSLPSVREPSCFRDKPQEIAAVARRIGAARRGRQFIHGPQRRVSLVFRIAKDHPERGHRGRPDEIARGL